jgi:hypothetical protein
MTANGIVQRYCGEEAVQHSVDDSPDMTKDRRQHFIIRRLVSSGFERDQAERIYTLGEEIEAIDQHEEQRYGKQRSVAIMRKWHTCRHVTVTRQCFKREKRISSIPTCCVTRLRCTACSSRGRICRQEWMGGGGGVHILR